MAKKPVNQAKKTGVCILAIPAKVGQCRPCASCLHFRFRMQVNSVPTSNAIQHTSFTFYIQYILKVVETWELRFLFCLLNSTIPRPLLMPTICISLLTMEIKPLQIYILQYKKPYFLQYLVKCCPNDRQYILCIIFFIKSLY